MSQLQPPNQEFILFQPSRKPFSSSTKVTDCRVGYRYQLIGTNPNTRDSVLASTRQGIEALDRLNRQGITKGLSY